MAELPSVAQVIEQLRAELAEATAKGAGQDIRFDMGEIQVEREALVTTEGKGGLNLKVPGVGFEGGGGASSASTIKLTLKLKPKQVTPDGGTQDLTASRTFEVE